MCQSSPKCVRSQRGVLQWPRPHKACLEVLFLLRGQSTVGYCKAGGKETICSHCGSWPSLHTVLPECARSWDSVGPACVPCRTIIWVWVCDQGGGVAGRSLLRPRVELGTLTKQKAERATEAQRNPAFFLRRHSEYVAASGRGLSCQTLFQCSFHFHVMYTSCRPECILLCFSSQPRPGQGVKEFCQLALPLGWLTI